jgi:hypothetical protein
MYQKILVGLFLLFFGLEALAQGGPPVWAFNDPVADVYRGRYAETIDIEYTVNEEIDRWDTFEFKQQVKRDIAHTLRQKFKKDHQLEHLSVVIDYVLGKVEKVELGGGTVVWKMKAETTYRVFSDKRCQLTPDALLDATFSVGAGRFKNGEKSVSGLRFNFPKFDTPRPRMTNELKDWFRSFFASAKESFPVLIFLGFERPHTSAGEIVRFSAEEVAESLFPSRARITSPITETFRTPKTSAQSKIRLKPANKARLCLLRIFNIVTRIAKGRL